MPKRSRNYQMTIEFATDSEVNARTLITKAIGSAYMSGIKIQGWTLADVTRGNYRGVVSHQEQEKKRRRRGGGG